MIQYEEGIENDPSRKLPNHLSQTQKTTNVQDGISHDEEKENNQTEPTRKDRSTLLN